MTFVKKDLSGSKGRKLPLPVKRMWNKKSKLSKAILKSKSVEKLSTLREEFMEVKDALKVSYERFRYQKELKVIEGLKENPRLFYNYARSKSTVQS